MKRTIALLAAAASLGAAAIDYDFEQPALVPAPQKADWRLDACTELDDGFVLCLTCPKDGGQAAAWLAAKVKEAFGISCKVEAPTLAPVENLGPEEYRLLTYKRGVEIRAGGFAGVRWAFMTLRQMVQPKRGTATVQGWICPAAKISDAPAFAFRGMHLCWFPETSAAQIERAIRLAGYYKFNVVVLETWGAFRSEKYPWYGWPDGKMTKQEIARLVALGRDLGVTLVPQLNVFGHATMSRWSSGKHAGLDFHPEHQPVFEPRNGWNWCLSNPEAIKMIKELAAEMHEAFGNPPYFHVGCDEATNPSCPVCRAADYPTLVANAIGEVSKTLKARGARPMMWHDMLLEKGKWGRFYANGKNADKLLGLLPREMVICDWFYNDGVSPEGYPTFAHFKKAGFDVLTCPWRSPDGTRAQGKAALEAGATGVLGTTWHHLYGADVEKIFVPTADAAWGGGARVSDGSYFATHLRQMGWDMKLVDQRETGWYNEQIPGSTISPCGN